MIQSLEIRVPEIERSFRCIPYFYSFWEPIRLDASPAGWSISIATDLKRDALTLFVGANGERVTRSCAMAQKELEFCVICGSPAVLQRTEPAIRMVTLRVELAKAIPWHQRNHAVCANRVRGLCAWSRRAHVVTIDRSVAIEAHAGADIGSS